MHEGRTWDCPEGAVGRERDGFGDGDGERGGGV